MADATYSEHEGALVALRGIYFFLPNASVVLQMGNLEQETIPEAPERRSVDIVNVGQAQKQLLVDIYLDPRMSGTSERRAQQKILLLF